jgi:hypothetical protein
MSTSAEDYRAKAEDALTQLAAATSESERTRLKRAHGCFLRLANHGAEAAARAAMRAPPKIRPEKAPPAPRPQPSYFK